MEGTSSFTASDICSARGGPDPTPGPPPRLLRCEGELATRWRARSIGGIQLSLHVTQLLRAARDCGPRPSRMAVAGPRLAADQLRDDVGPGRAEGLPDACRERWIGGEDHDDEEERGSQNRDEEAVKIDVRSGGGF